MHGKFPPGPRDYCFGMRTMSQMKKDVLGTYQSLHREYGDAVSFVTGPYRLYIFYHPTHAHDLLVTRAKSTVRLPRVMDTFAQWNGQSVLIAEGEQWIRQRRLVQQAFHPRRLANYGEMMVAAAESLAQSWDESLANQPHLDVNVDETMTRLTLAIIGRTMFASDLDDVAQDIAVAVDELSRIGFLEMQSPLRLPNWIPTKHNRRKLRAIDVLDRAVWRMVRARREDGEDYGDLLSMLLAVNDEGNSSQGLTDKQVRDEAMTLMLAGHDTTAAAFNWLWYCLSSQPLVQQKCHQELDQVLAGAAPQFDDVERLPYLTATVKETLRLYPPAIGIFLRQATKDITIGEHPIRRGSLMTLSSFVTQRDERWFPDPERFDPERFLPDREEAIPTGAYFPFGAGPRVCIGQGMAMTELVLVAATLLQRFSVCMPPDEPAPQMHVTVSLRPKHPLHLRFEPRSVACADAR